MAISVGGNYENITGFIMYLQKKLISIVPAFNRCYPGKRALREKNHPSVYPLKYCDICFGTTHDEEFS